LNLATHEKKCKLKEDLKKIIPLPADVGTVATHREERVRAIKENNPFWLCLVTGSWGSEPISTKGKTFYYIFFI
jgi:hypothetical protein